MTEYEHTLAVRRTFIAQHVLTVPDPEPPEDEVNSHEFTVELIFSGESLGEYDYLLDITEVESVLDELVERYRDTLLNDLPEFEGHNPSIEQFARVIGDRIERDLSAERVEQLRVKVWEDDLAWASHARTV